MSNKMLICRACLATDVSLYNIHDKEITEPFMILMGISISATDGMPPYICGVCTHLLRKFKKYRDRCHSSSQILQSMVLNNELTMDQVNDIERKGILYLTQTYTQIISLEPTQPLCNQIVTTDVPGSMTYPKIETNGMLIKIENETYLGTHYVENNLNDDKEIVFNEHFMMNTADDMLNSEENDFDKDVGIISDGDKSFHEEPTVINSVTASRKRGIDALESKDIVKDIKVTKGKQKKQPLTNINRLSDIKRKTDNILKRNNKGKNNIKVPTKEEEELEKNCEIYYENLLGMYSNKILNKRLKYIDDFAKQYNYEIKYLTKEEQKNELEDMKVQQQHMPYQCNICYQGYRKKDTYDTHMLGHDPVAGDYECDICSICVKTKRYLNEHIRNRHFIRLTCKLCGKVVRNISAGRAHHAIHGEAQFNCDMCNKTFKKSSNYYDHIRQVHKKDGVNCLICGQTFKGEAGVTGHMNKIHRRAVRCNTCNQYFETKRALIKHLENSADGACAAGVKACNQCGEGFETIEELRDHFTQHGNVFNTCVRCNQAFYSPRALDIHWDSCNPSGSTSCSTYKPRARSNKPRAKSNKPRAPYGSKLRKTKYPTQFVCEVCGREFSHRSYFEEHMRLHTGEKPHKCTLCPKAFRVFASLQLHELQHRDEWPHRCTICGNKFRQSTHLRRHMKVHTGEKSYVCSVCNKAFTQACNMREHTRTVHEGLPPRWKQRNKLRTVEMK